ncbi:baculoviral IAP repeat-containing protein 6 isoform X2 [Tribolium castaneum]|uniref:baculoviral IAP repeat-containing protein 6 isoform X2 n=1 Tax=Tribolium castaneum TaxID=7070 RepID=UPI00046C31CB|nr:PREDICTED: baculoviral IAP repeat-containing protein 6 isoform X2 [Tribolium castaneum]|eukprot:XP_008195667.1 PREDICTED: baculoviral IAP repeat-containing protein 6 isoform X2 [Tribolium castaneum]
MAQDVFSKMAEDPWLLNEDGYLNADTDIKEIIYHPTLNVILICTNSGIVRVLDVNSGVVLQSSYLSAINQNEVTCKYIPGQDRVLFCDGQAIGVRSDYNSVLLLDSILQKPVSDPKKEIKLELPLSEAIILKQSLTSANVSGIEHVINELTDVILNAQKQSKKGIKAQKWNTVCLQLPLEMLQMAAMSSVSELLLKNQHTPELSVASAVQERLSELSGEQGSASDRRSMASEAKRRETFTHWPHMDYKWALPDQMAQAGFYHQPNASGDDRAMCFTCTVCLVCWERTDEPWSEHERHSPSCPFVMGEYTQNVPLSVTYATNPAIDATYRGVNVKILGTSTLSNLLPSANAEGLISVFDISGKISRTHSFFVTQFDSHILEKYTQDFGVPGTWSDLDEVKYPAEKRITSLAIVSTAETTSTRPTIICGLQIRCRAQKYQSPVIGSYDDQNKNLMEVVESATSSTSFSCLYLVVYDFMYSKEKEDKDHESKPNDVNAISEVTAPKNESTQNENQKNSDYVHPDAVFVEHLSSFYKTLIPGESDEVFLPPPMLVNKPQHSGPRVLPIDMQITETDASQTEPFIINQEYSFMNGQLSSILSETFEKSISDHITEMKNNKTAKKLNYSRAVQCVSIPAPYKSRQDLEISDIIATQDSRHVLVVLKSSLDGKSVLILYSLDFSQKMVKLVEEPVLVRELNNNEKPTEVSMLPMVDKLGEFAEQGKNGVVGNIVMVCVDGAVRIVELSTMKTICMAQLESEKFVSAAYCNSLERLCASTAKGSLHFYALNDTDNESSEDHEEDDLFGMTTDGTSSNPAQTSDSLDGSEMTRCFHDPPEIISLIDLKRLHALCQFEPLRAGYCAVVPPCWSEIQQAQRQRRYPQSLKTDCDQYTKTWRLQTDTTTWDEHIFEITLPSPMSLGHVDVHFSLQSSTALPHVEVTLLRQNTSGIGHKKDVKFAVDETITIDMLQQWADNPVISQEYLRAHNADILAGPVNIASCLDLSEQCGVVTLTSPKLFKSRNRTLLLHIRAVYSKEEANNKTASKRKRSESKDKTGQCASHKNEFYMGCDCIHELSITVYSSKHTEIPHERSQRNFMLESISCVQSLLLTAMNNSSNESVSLSLDVLTWIASIRLIRNRSNNGEVPNQQMEFLYVIEYNLAKLLQQCLLLGERSIAHKCMKLIEVCCNGAKNMSETGRSHFEFSILKALLSLLNTITDVRSPGGLQWIFALLLKVISKNAQYVATKCVTLLNKMSEELENRTNPYHLLLRSRYGLYGTPLELELFDIEPPPYAKSTSTYVTYATAVSGDSANQNNDFFENYSFNKESINPKDVLSGTETKLKWRNLAPPKIYRGLIETVPLHFTCVSASEGTRLERADASNNINNIVINEIPFSITPFHGQGSLDKMDHSKFKSYLVDFVEEPTVTVKEYKNSNPQATTSSVGTWDDNGCEVLIGELPVDVGNHLLKKLDSMYQDLKSSMENKSSAVKNVWQPESLLSPPTNSSLPWQHLLVTPPQQVIVVERMHSGARRYVVLDFGQPILLTDILLPSCNDLVSVSIDIWLKSEDVDGTRLVVAADIGSKNLVLNDLQPAPLCRYMKITTVGRYGMTTARCRIPIGYFYGHVVVLPEEVPPDLSQNVSNLACTDLDKQLTILSKLFEDISCRYSLACSKLKELLRPFLVADMKNASHLATYMNIMKDKALNTSNPEHSKIFSAYQESITYQRQLNTIRNVMNRLEGSISKMSVSPRNPKDIPNASTDKLRAIAEGLLEVLLTLDSAIEIDPVTCRKLFQGLCVSQASRLQLLTAIFLDKSCRTKSYWGNFLADTLTEMFATSNTTKFPQDRVFILLAYLSRKSPERSAVIDAGLRVVSQTLAPLTGDRSNLLAVSVDLPLLSWLLMYLSLQLDLSKNSLQSATRWDWVFGEIVGKVNAESAKIGSRKKNYKRISKQQIDNLDAAQKLVQSSAQALSTLSNHAACLTSKLDAALKTQQFLMKKVKYKFMDMKNSPAENPLAPKKLKETAAEPVIEKITEKKMPQHIDVNHCLTVAKGLLTLVLSMDHSSSADMLLLSFKVMARLVSMAKIKLGQLMNQEQLLNLFRFCLASKIPWAPHALACLLQDVVENENDTDSGASTSWATNDFLSDVANLCEFTDDETFVHEPVITAPPKTGNNNNQLPSVYESDDSDLEEIVDGFLDKEAMSTPKKIPKPTNYSHTTNSVALDSRLDLSVDVSAEISLRKLINKNTQGLLQSVNAPVVGDESEDALAPWPTVVLPLQPESLLSNTAMLTQCFDSLFENLPMQDSANIEHILQLWLTLNNPYKDDKFDPSAVAQIVLKESSVKALISAIAWTPGLSLITWCVALQTLTLVCNSNITSESSLYWSDSYGMASCIVNHPDFVQVFMRLLSGTGLTFIDKVLAGPSLCKALNDFLDRLLMRCYVESPRSKAGKSLKTLLLKIVHQLVLPTGPIALRQGPLDVQCKLLKIMLDIDYFNADMTIAMSIFESTCVLVHSYFVNVDKIKCINIGEKHNVVTTTFNEIFACVMGSDPIKMDLQVSTEVLFLRLLKFLGKLVQTQFRQGIDQPEAMDVEPLATSQTDESKAEQIQQDSMRNRGENFADLVLQYHANIMRLCQSLAACKSSSLCMLANVSQKAAFSNLSEPSNVGDAVFHVLALLAKRTSDKKLVLPPLLQFLAHAPQLSEPLLWFLLQILNNEEAIRNFLTAGGIEILGRSFVTSSNTPNTISKSGTISIVMQHFSGINPTSDASTAIASASASRKLQQATIENKLSLVNFAPCCTISCPSGTAQPAEVLIQGTAATHRRARTPQWSYHFYPDEAHTELTLQLPSAILLREVHLQPHLSALATCPSAVALEVSANGPSRLVPVCPPLPTSGMVFIRLHLPVPEVVNCVLIRLYRPRDANNIGLSQIRLLGNLAFGGNTNQNLADPVEDESHCRHSLGWLRLLHHCFTLPTEQDLAKQVIACASGVPRLLSTCCELLLVPSHVLPIYLPCLEKVLRELSLHNLENGNNVIKILLNSRSSIIEPLNFADNAWQDRLLINATGYQSACELLYQICEHQDSDTFYRVKMMLEWLQSVAVEAMQTGNTQGCNPAYISSIASILWSANQARVSYDLPSMITLDFFDTIYNLKTCVENNIALKYSLDSLLCSLCYIRPELFPVLLQRIGVLVPNLSTDHDASISDDRKDSESMTDDNKQTFELDSEWYGHLVMGELSKLSLSNEQLETVALVSRSPSAIQQLLDSGLPKMLNSAIYEFCTSNEDNSVPMAKLENVTAILKFFTDVSDEKTMRDWLGSSDGSSFWLELLNWLCKKPFLKKSNLQSEAHAQLEEVCVKFLSKCCLCHPSNQARLANVLCKVIDLQSNGISGFMRRLTLQLLLENEKIPVSIKADETLYKSVKLTQAYLPVHPAFKQTYNRALLYLSTNTTLADILEQHIYFNTTYKMETNNSSKRPFVTKKDLFKGWFPEDSDLSMAAGVTAKDKRAKDAKNQAASTPQSKKKRYTATESLTSGDVIGGRLIKCEAYSDQPLPLNLNLGQLLRLIESKGTTADWPCVHLVVCQNKNGDKKSESSEVDSSLYQQQPFSSALQVFSSMGGLALLARHLPTVYPEAVRPPLKEKTTSEQSDSEWIKVEDCDDIYEDVEETVGTSSPSKSSGLISNVPAHSLTAFGLFLRLPGYAEVLLKDMKKALCLLRLVLGVTDDGEGGDIFQSPIADSLPTLPFEVLRKLYDATPLSTDDGRLLRRISINTGVVHLLLACLGIFTHQTQNNEKEGQKDAKGKDERSQLYWAKGTGYGTGSTQQIWNVEQALLKQKSEEEHVTVLLQVLASYISPNGETADELMEDVLPSSFHDLLANSSLLPALSSYLRNDSVLDMARHIPLYRAALQLLRALATSSQLVDLLLPQKTRINEPSISSLLKSMKTCVDTYASKLRLNTKTNTKFKTKLREQLEELEQGEGLATLMPDIQDTANLVSKVTSGLVDSDHDSEGEVAVDRVIFASLEEKYLKIMKSLQFGSYEMITELPEGGVKFAVSHHFENNAKSTGEQSHPARVKRIAQEAVTLSTSLPLSYSSSVFVRYDTSRLDVMKVLMTGPADTPYANGCFEFDVFFPPDYPLSPMMINLETTGHHTIRFNPNLYNDGKVCLSVLNTWHGRPEEKWNAQTSNFLQVLVSIQSLILVPEPYFNEPGYERSRGTPAGTQSSREYNANVSQATVRWAMLEQILNPCLCFKDVIYTHFYLKRHEILAQVEGWIKDLENDITEKRISRTANKRSPTANIDSFKKIFQQLKEQLTKLKPPEGVVEEDPAPKMETTSASVNGLEGNEQEMDADIDMEKMVKEMCEFDAT